MRRRRRLLVDCLLSACLAALLVAALGNAHTFSEWYKLKWGSGDRSQNYGFASDVPGGNFRDRVEDGAQQWNALSGNMQFHRGGVNVTWSYSFECSNRQVGDNSMHWGWIDGPPQPGEFNTYGTTRHCVRGDDDTKLAISSIKFDSGDTWHNGTDDPPENKVDTWALATHEFGHAGGFGTGTHDHFPGSWDVCQPPGDKHTMCQGLPYGKKFWRSLEYHDRETFNNGY